MQTQEQVAPTHEKNNDHSILTPIINLFKSWLLLVSVCAAPWWPMRMNDTHQFSSSVFLRPTHCCTWPPAGHAFQPTIIHFRLAFGGPVWVIPRIRVSSFPLLRAEGGPGISGPKHFGVTSRSAKSTRRLDLLETWDFLAGLRYQYKVAGISIPLYIIANCLQ